MIGKAVITKKSDNSPCHCEVASEKQIVLWTFAAKERAVAGTDDSDVAISSRTLRLPRRYASRNDSVKVVAHDDMRNRRHFAMTVESLLFIKT